MLMDIVSSNWFIVVVVMFIAGIVKGCIGMGLPLIASSLLVLFFSPLQVLSIIAPTIFFTNFLQAFRYGNFIIFVKTYWPFLSCLLFGITLTAYTASSVNPRWIYFSISLALVMFLLSNIKSLLQAVKTNALDTPISDKKRKIWGVIAGLFAGIIGGLSSAWGPPSVIYFQWLGLKKEDFIGALGWSFFIGSIPLNISYMANGIMTTENFPLAFAGLFSAVVAFTIGEKLRHLVNEQLFKKLVLLFLTIMAVHLFIEFLSYK